MPLDVARGGHADRAIVGRRLGLDAIDTAAGIHEIVNQNMAAAARMHAVEQGVDLRGVSVLAFGGAGPVHACGVAELLESTGSCSRSTPACCRRSARSCRRCASTSPARWSATSTTHRRGRARRGCSTSCAPRVVACCSPPACPPTTVRFRYGVDARYAGQGNEVTVWVGEGDARGRPATTTCSRAFEAEYRRIYGLTIPDVGIEVVTWRLSAVVGGTPSSSRRRSPPVRRATPTGHRAGRVRRAAAPPSTTPVYRRADLGAGDRFDGPAIVEERETTVVVRPGWRVEVAPDGSLVATRREPTCAASIGGQRDRRDVRPDRARDPVAEPDRHRQRAGAGAAARGLQPDRARGGRPRQRRVRPARPDGRPGRHRHARPHQLAGDRRRQHPRRVPDRHRSSRATC